ncbi:hypothetical protein JOM56_010688 [Amanita muscaria]
MPREGRESPLSSSLPSVLLPHLLQQRRDSVSNPSTTDRQVPPMAPLTREMGTLSTNGSPQQSLSPVSVSPTPGFSYTGNHGSQRFYPPYARPDLETSNQISFAGSGDPQVSGVRHTLGTLNIHATGHRYSSPIYSDPIYYTSQSSTSFRPGQGYPLSQPPPREQFSRPGWTNWREGETGQASLTFSRSPVAAHQLARLNQQTDTFNGPIWPEEQPDGFSNSVLTQAESSRHSLRAGIAIPSQRLSEPRSSHHSPTIQELPPPHALFPGSEVPSPAIYGSRHEAYADLAQSPVGQRTWPSEESASGTDLIPPVIPSQRERDSSEARSIGTEEHDDGSKSAQRKKRRREPVNSTRKDERPKKTAVACNFCRGRKLKCDGERPTCGVCCKRGLDCEYVEKPKRRGPGKASKSSKRGEQGGPVSPSPSTSIMEPERENMAESASPRQAYTSVISLENFTFRQPTSPTRGGTRPGSQDGSS